MSGDIVTTCDPGAPCGTMHLFEPLAVVIVVVVVFGVIIRLREVGIE